MNFTNSPFERMMRQRPGTDSDHPCISCRHRSVAAISAPTGLCAVTRLC